MGSRYNFAEEYPSRQAHPPHPLSRLRHAADTGDAEILFGGWRLTLAGLCGLRAGGAMDALRYLLPGSRFRLTFSRHPGPRMP
jgi:hypothetical protein